MLLLQSPLVRVQETLAEQENSIFCCQWIVRLKFEIEGRQSTMMHISDLQTLFSDAEVKGFYKYFD